MAADCSECERTQTATAAAWRNIRGTAGWDDYDTAVAAYYAHAPHPHGGDA